jgi:hypothetical protein
MFDEINWMGVGFAGILFVIALFSVTSSLWTGMSWFTRIMIIVLAPVCGYVTAEVMA